MCNCRMRSVNETAQFFKDMDPDTQITARAIRKMIAQGTIPTVKVGNKNLINLDILLDRLNSSACGKGTVFISGNMAGIEK